MNEGKVAKHLKEKDTEKQKRKKSRLVPPENRRRAAFSCDRCKTKKIKCNRADDVDNELKYDKVTPCVNCQRLNLECKTSIPRRRRVYSSFENLGLHYQTLLTLVQGIYPDVDTNDINELLRLGDSLGLKMMHPGTQQDGVKKFEMESRILKPFSPRFETPGSGTTSIDESKSVGVDGVSQDQGMGNTLPNEGHDGKRSEDVDDKRQHALNFTTSDTLVVDSRGGTHYIGSSGTPVLFTVLCDLLLKRSYRSNLSFDYELKLFQNKVDNHSKIPISELILKEPNFPLIGFIKREESDYYINFFFRFFHPFYFIFDEQSFRSKYERFWKIIGNKDASKEKSDNELLSNSYIGCIYLVWLISSKNSDYQTTLDYGKIIEVLQIILSDVALASTINSIQFLYLFARYLHSNKNRDSAWNLIGLAIRQAISLGIHKKIMSKKTEHANLTSQVLWSLYKIELTLCSTFGRPSNINEEEIDIDYPNLDQVPYLDPDFKNYYLTEIKLSRFLNKILKERKTSHSQQPISLINIERTLLMKNQLIQTYNELYITPIDKIKTIYDYKLNLVFNYYMVTLTLPFMVYIATTNYKVRTDETLLNIMKTGIDASITCSKLLRSAVEMRFNYGALATDCIYGYSATLVLALFFIYLSNSSNDMLELDIANKMVDKKVLMECISNVTFFMNSSRLDSTTTRILEVLEGIKNDLKLVEIQDNLKFDVLNFDGSDEVFDSLLTSNDIYTNGFDLGTSIGF